MSPESEEKRFHPRKTECVLRGGLREKDKKGGNLVRRRTNPRCDDSSTTPPGGTGNDRTLHDGSTSLRRIEIQKRSIQGKRRGGEKAKVKHPGFENTEFRQSRKAGRPGGKGHPDGEGRP